MPSAVRERQAEIIWRSCERRVGRPTSLTPNLAARIIGYVLDGSYIETAVLACGVSKKSFYNWRARAEEWMVSEEPVPEDEAIYIQFLHSVNWAEARAEIDLLRYAASGARGWQAAMTVLERKYPSRWGRQEKRVHEGGDPKKPVVVQTEGDTERRKAVAKILEEAGALDGQG